MRVWLGEHRWQNHTNELWRKFRTIISQMNGKWAGEIEEYSVRFDVGKKRDSLIHALAHNGSFGSIWIPLFIFNPIEYVSR